MKICDLHTHSNFSDGSFSPTQLVIEAKRVGLFAIALTDHNSIDGIGEFLSACKEHDIEGIVGAEFSTDFCQKELHILGLFIPKDRFSLIDDMCKEVRQNKEKSNKIMIERLQNAGYDITYEEVASVCQGTMNRAHIGEVLYKKGYTKTVEEVFDVILSKKGKIYHSAKRLDAIKTIEYLTSLGIVTVLAHPFLDLTEEELIEFLTVATPKGLTAMETIYTTYDERQTALAKKIAKQFNLKESGGSDFHGYRKNDVALAVGRGNLVVPYEICKNLKDTK